mgnify:CR=1 FL=1
MLLGLLPFALNSAYASTLRECGETMIPMIASFAAMFGNLLLNYVLIFGHLGFAPMGASGAAVATVISRYLEFGIVLVRAHGNTEKFPFAKKLYRGFRIPARLFKQMLVKALIQITSYSIIKHTS